MNRNIKTTLTFLVFTLFIFSTFTFAQAKTDAEIEEYKKQLREEKSDQMEQYKMDAQNDKQKMMEERKDQFEEKVQVRTEKRCEIVVSHIDNRLSHYKDNKDSHLDKYERLLVRLQEISLKLETEGFDTSDLNNAITEFETLTDEYVATYAAFIAQLESTKELACGDSEGAFKDSLEEAHTLLVQARTQRKAVLEFYRTEVRSVIKDLRDQAKKLQVEGDSNE